MITPAFYEATHILKKKSCFSHKCVKTHFQLLNTRITFEYYFKTTNVNLNHQNTMKRTQSQFSMYYPFLENETYSALSARSKLIFHACFQLWTKRGEKPVTIDKHLNRYIALFIGEHAFSISSLNRKIWFYFKKLGLSIINRKITFVFAPESDSENSNSVFPSREQKGTLQQQNGMPREQSVLFQEQSGTPQNMLPKGSTSTQTPVHHNFKSVSDIKKRRR